MGLLVRGGGLVGWGRLVGVRGSSDGSNGKESNKGLKLDTIVLLSICDKPYIAPFQFQVIVFAHLPSFCACCDEVGQCLTDAVPSDKQHFYTKFDIFVVGYSLRVRTGVPPHGRCC